MIDEHFLLWGDYAFYNVEYVEDVLEGDGSYLLMANVRHATEGTESRSYICKEWYHNFRLTVAKGQKQYSSIRSFTQLRKALLQVLGK